MLFVARYRLEQVKAIKPAFLFTRMKLTFDSSLKGMTQLDRSRFKTTVQVPVIKIPKNEYNVAKKTMRAYALESLVNVKKFQDIDANDESSKTHKYLLLDPDVFSFDKLDESTRAELQKIVETKSSEELKNRIETISLDIGYDDLKFEQVMKAIIPDEIFAENLNPKSYSVIGHIAHFNLRDKLLDYKHIIGETLLDKIGQIKTVVNKLNEIDNTYRNFAFEFMAGEKNTLVACRENGCEFRFDFANVYWNPRLSTEHERVVKMLEPMDVLYDVFAGVGPFSVPAAVVRKLDTVVCNDLNPESYRFLIDNYKNNTKSKTKLKEIDERKRRLTAFKMPETLLPSKRFTFNPKELFTAYNMDGREFIRSVVKHHLAEVINYRQVNKIDDTEFTKGKYYVLMNLPALSVEFLDAFVDLYDSVESDLLREKLGESVMANFHLNVHCYHFCRDQKEELDAIQQRIRGSIYGDESLQIESKWVRKVAPSKDMFCSIFKLRFKHLMFNKDRLKKKLDDHNEVDSPSSKIAKTD